MIFCRSCKRVSPHKSRFCGHCAKSFGGRLCPKGHKNPVFANCCTECASTELSTSTNFVSVRPLTFVFSTLVVLTVLKWSVSHFDEIATVLLAIFDWSLNYVTGESAMSLLCRFLHFLLLMFVPFLLWWAIAERFKTPSQSIGFYTKLVVFLGKCAARFLAALFQFLVVRDHNDEKNGRQRLKELKRAKTVSMTIPTMVKNRNETKKKIHTVRCHVRTDTDRVQARKCRTYQPRSRR